MPITRLGYVRKLEGEAEMSDRFGQCQLFSVVAFETEGVLTEPVISQSSFQFASRNDAEVEEMTQEALLEFTKKIAACGFSLLAFCDLLLENGPIRSGPKVYWPEEIISVVEAILIHGPIYREGDAYPGAYHSLEQYLPYDGFIIEWLSEYLEAYRSWRVGRDTFKPEDMIIRKGGRRKNLDGKDWLSRKSGIDLWADQLPILGLHVT